MQIEETTIDHIRSRPRFKIFTDISREEYTVYLKSFLKEREQEFSGNINNEASLITVKTKEDNYWKPNLALRTEIDSEENKTESIEDTIDKPEEETGDSDRHEDTV